MKKAPLVPESDVKAFVFSELLGVFGEVEVAGNGENCDCTQIDTIRDEQNSTERDLPEGSCWAAATDGH